MSGSTLFAEERRYFPAGYGPRSIQFSRDASDLIVGFKDGTIHVVKGLREVGPWTPVSLIPETPRAGARSLLVASDDSLLVGRDGGGLDALTKWADEGNCGIETCRPPIAPSVNPGGVTLVAEPVDKKILVSTRFKGLWFKPLDALRDTSEWQLVGATNDPTLGSGLLCIAPLGEESEPMLAVSDRGTFFKVTLGDPPAIEQCSPDPGPRIGFVSDFALVKPEWNPDEWDTGGTARPGPLHAEGIYLATDAGLYLVWLDKIERDFHWSRVALPGVGAALRAVSYFADRGSPGSDTAEDDAGLDRGKRFLWVADSGGDAYMFMTSKTIHAEVMRSGALPGNHHFWQPCGIRHQGTQVQRAFMSPYRPRQKDGAAPRPLLVGQASRNAPVVVSLYRPIGGEST